MRNGDSLSGNSMPSMKPNSPVIRTGWVKVTRSRLEDGKNIPAHTYINAKGCRAELITELARVMCDVDVLVLPTNKKPAQVLGYELTPLGDTELSLTRPFKLMGNPALALCSGFTAGGLPLSIQNVDRPFEDDMVLGRGYALQKALHLRSRRPPRDYEECVIGDYAINVTEPPPICDYQAKARTATAHITVSKSGRCSC